MAGSARKWANLSKSGLGVEPKPKAPPGIDIKDPASFPPTPSEPLDSKSSTPEKNTKIVHEEEIQEGEMRYVVIKVEKAMTMDDLVEHYEVSKEDIRIYNDLPSRSDNIQLRNFLRIPVTGKPRPVLRVGEGNVEDMAISELQLLHRGLSKEDARSYLVLSDWDVETAHREILEDDDMELFGEGAREVPL